MSMQKKQCSKCGEEKPVNAFSSHARTRDLLQPYCKECMSTVNRARYERHRQAAMTDEEKALMRRQHVNLANLGAFLLKHPCECGERVPSSLLLVLKTTGREFPVLDKVKKLTPESLETTLERCQVRCANCQRRVTSPTARLLDSIAGLRSHAVASRKVPTRIAVYHRVSTLDQNPGLARDELRAAAARVGGEVVLDIEETGSGARNDRPGLQRLMDAARRGKLDAVMVWKLDRFGRSALDVLANIRDLDAAGVRFIATTQGIDIRPGGDAMSRLILGVLASVAEFERDLIRERTRLGMAKARAAGKRIGRPRAARPKRAEVQRLRKLGRSWREVSSALGCSTWAARQAG